MDWTRVKRSGLDGIGLITCGGEVCMYVCRGKVSGTRL